MSRTPPALGRKLRRSGLRLAALAALWTLAGALRLEGVKWGIPNWTRFYPYHPDESVLLHAACQINPLWGDFAPSFYNYGSLYILLCRLAYDFAAPLMGWGAVPGDPDRFTDWLWAFSRVLAVGRLVNVGLGIALVGVTLLLARLLWTRAAGWWAGVFLAVAPMPVLLGRYMTVDFPATFLATFALAFAAAALRARSPRQRLGWVTASAGAIALSAGTKYHVFVAPVVLALTAWDRWGLDDLGWPPWLPILGGAFLAGVGFAPLWVAHWETWRERRKLAPVALALLLSGVAFAICFVISTPGCLLEFETFWRDLRWEMGRNREGMGYLFEATPPSAIYHLTVSLPIALEWPLYLLCVVGVGWSLVRRRREDLLLWLFVLPTFGALALSERKFLRYVAPLLPPLVVLAGRFLAELGGAGDGRRRVWARGLAGALGGIAAAAALASSFAHVRVMVAGDVRERAVADLRAMARPDDVVALASDAWFYTPPIHPTAGCVKVARLYGGPPIWEAQGEPLTETLCRFAAREYVILAPRSHPPAGALPPNALDRYRPRWVIITDYEYEDAERIRRARPDFRHGILTLLEAMRTDYLLEREYRPRPHLLGFTWWRHGIPPHDWRYFMPTVRIYRRRDAPQSHVGPAISSRPQLHRRPVHRSPLAQRRGGEPPHRGTDGASARVRATRSRGADRRRSRGKAVSRSRRRVARGGRTDGGTRDSVGGGIRQP